MPSASSRPARSLVRSASVVRSGPAPAAPCGDRMSTGPRARAATAIRAHAWAPAARPGTITSGIAPAASGDEVGYHAYVIVVLPTRTAGIRVLSAFGVAGQRLSVRD